MRIALVHDYLNDYGGAERVLEVLAEMYPDAPIFTAFFRCGSSAYERLKHRDIRGSWAHHVPFFARKLHSPLRFLAPQIWRSFDFSGYDVVISSSSWYMTKGIRVPEATLHVSYIHTPPRYLYGYDTSINWKKYWLVRVYAAIVNKELRQFDYTTAQTVNVLVANSKNVQKRIAKFWRRESEVIYPPVEVQGIDNRLQGTKRGDYLLVISRLVGGKGLGLAVEAANQLHMPLKVVGTGAGWGHEERDLRALAGPTVEFLGHVSDDKLGALYAGAFAFLALAKDEDFGITPVEAQLAGIPVIAYRGGGYLETIIEGETGIFFDELTAQSLVKGIEMCKSISFERSKIRLHAQKFSKERFVKEMKELVNREWEKKRARIA